MNKIFKIATLAGAVFLAPALAGLAHAQTATAPAGPENSPVTLSSDVKIERTEIDATGKEKVVLRNPKDVVVVPGDSVVFNFKVNNGGLVAASGFRATNPVPDAVTFVEVNEDWAEVSVDGGATWGKLASLKINAKAAQTGVDQLRTAASEDVTHVRWVFADAIAASSKTSVSYRGVVK